MNAGMSQHPPFTIFYGNIAGMYGVEIREDIREDIHGDIGWYHTNDIFMVI